jgi:hypothetical protein
MGSYFSLLNKPEKSNDLSQKTKDANSFVVPGPVCDSIPTVKLNINRITEDTFH